MSTYLFVSTQYLPALGGVEKYTYELSSALVKRGHRVIVVTNVGPSFGWSQDQGIEILRLPSRGFLHGRYPVPKKDQQYQTLMDELRAVDFDYVAVNTRFYPLSIEGVKLAAEKGIVPVVIDHGSAHLTIGNPLVDIGVQAVEHAMTQRVLSYPAAFYGVSQASVQWLTHFGIEAAGTLPNAINADAFVEQASSRDYREELHLPADAFVVAFTGRLVPEKGVSVLLEAAELLADDTRIHLLLAGKGPLESALNAATTSNVHSLGALTSPDVAALLAQADVFCLPTRSEGFSTSLLESAACGTTPIITPVGGVEELVPDEQYGIVIPEARGEVVAEVVRSLARDRQACAQKGAALAERVRSGFSWDETACKFEQACQEANCS